ALNEYFAAEAQLGGFLNTESRAQDTLLANVPLLFNLKIQYPNRSRWMPYVGGGVGLAAAILDANTAIAPSASTFLRIRGTEVDAVLAYQGLAGLGYELNERTELALEYRYFAIEEPGWGFGVISLKANRIETHAISAKFTYRF